MKVEMFGTQKSAMTRSFRNFDFLSIYKADSAGLQTYPFFTLSNQTSRYICKCIRIYDNVQEELQSLIIT